MPRKKLPSFPEHVSAPVQVPRLLLFSADPAAKLGNISSQDIRGYRLQEIQLRLAQHFGIDISRNEWPGELVDRLTEIVVPGALAATPDQLRKRGALGGRKRIWTEARLRQISDAVDASMLRNPSISEFRACELMLKQHEWIGADIKATTLARILREHRRKMRRKPEGHHSAT